MSKDRILSSYLTTFCINGILNLFDIYIHPLEWGKTSWLSEDNEERKWIDQTIQKTTGQTSFQYTKNLINKSKNIQVEAQSKVSEYKKSTMKMVENIKINSDEFFASVKSNIEKTRGNLLD